MVTIELLVPSLSASQAGNTVTADRYRAGFAALGHHARIVPIPTGDADLVVALNAYRSAPGIASTAERTPVIVVLTGTDVYRFLEEDPGRVHASLDRATRLVGLNHRVGDQLSPAHRRKLVVIKEAAAPGLPRRPDLNRFEVAVVGHLRPEKDPELVAAAVRDLPPGSRVLVCHYGEAYTEDWADWARAESATNLRYAWRGPIPRSAIDHVYATSHLLVNSSRIEGGANAVSEAIMAGLPILASDISGNRGVLGPSYPGYFPAGNAAALRAALLRLSTDPALLVEFADAVVALQPEFGVETEKRLWGKLLSELGVGR